MSARKNKPDRTAAAMNFDELPGDAILRWETIKAFVPKSRAQIDRDEIAGRFPQRVQLGRQAVGWRWCEIRAWLRDRPRAPMIGPASIRRAREHQVPPTG